MRQSSEAQWFSTARNNSATFGDAEALIGQLRAANARLENINILYDAALGLIPRAAQEAIDAYPYPSAAPQDVRDTYQRHYEASDTSALDDQSETVCERIADIEVQIIQTPATTLRGALSKARVAWHITAEHEDLDETDPGFDPDHGRLFDPVMIWSILRDLERLAGGRVNWSSYETGARHPCIGARPVVTVPAWRAPRPAMAKHPSRGGGRNLIRPSNEIALHHLV